MENDDRITVEVVYARSDEQVIIELNVATDTTVEQAIRSSKILERFPEIDLRVHKVGVFGRLAELSQSLRHRDRVEIYRPLIADPKELRKKRAAQSPRKKSPG